MTRSIAVVGAGPAGLGAALMLTLPSTWSRTQGLPLAPGLLAATVSGLLLDPRPR